MIGLPDLTWFPKPFGAGDTDGSGARKALGKPDVSLPQLLVRETAQNSWDARVAGTVPIFEMRLRKLDDAARDVLRWNVFRESSPRLGLDPALSSETLWALEISDRGTKGLGGPTRNDIEMPPGHPTDYADFVLTLGAPPDSADGGGTFGFGKTAAYNASECSTIVIWSRSRVDGYLTERFIASAMGPRFSIDGQVFTGRQWWGLSANQSGAESSLRFEPAVGSDARRLGDAVFERQFEGDETGTSLLVIQPRGWEDPATLVAEWADAITQNLWAKLPTSQPLKHRMNVRLYREGNQVPIVIPAESPVLEARMRCLDAVRAIQAGQQPDDPLVRVETIERHNPPQELGHLAMTRLLGPSQGESLSVDSVTYMRSKAELVVRDEPMGPTPDGLSRWVGVFKSAHELDPVFASAEPPAHDTWSPNGPEDRRWQTIIRVALREIRRKADDYRNPLRASFDAGDSNPTGALSAALAGLTGSVGGSRANRQVVSRPRGPSATRETKPKVEVVRVRPLPRTSEDLRLGRQVTRVTLGVKSRAKTVTLSAKSLSVAVDGGVMASEGQVQLEGWAFGEAEELSLNSQSTVRVQTGQLVHADLSYPAGIAIDFTFTASEA